MLPMTNDPTVAAALERMYRRTTHGIRPGLEMIRALLAEIGHPENDLVCLHVAGTNGKGSVCAMMESVLRAAGLRTGLYTSPHLVRFNERIRVHGRSISDVDLARLLEYVEPATERVEKMSATPRPCTFFEMTTAMAFEQFRREKVAVAVIETGMGGRWDATNVVTPAVAVICDVDYDHMQYLGQTLEAIAAEKAGIIKSGRPVVTGVRRVEALAVIADEARRQGAVLIRAEEAVSVRRLGQDWRGQRIHIETASRRLPPLYLPLLGGHQLRNVAIAVAALECLCDIAGLEWPDEVWKRGLETVYWPARLQVLNERPVTLLDGGHNPHAARALAEALRELAPRAPVGLIAGLVSDKDHAGFFRELTPIVACAWIVPVYSERAAVPSDVAAAARAAGLGKVEESDLPTAWSESRIWAERAGGIVCIAGSLFLAGEVLAFRMGDRDLYDGSV